MIKITPAILVHEESEFIEQFNKYINFFESIDIDINIDGDSFYGEVTVYPGIVNKHIQKSVHNSFTLHLMVSQPAKVIQEYFTDIKKLSHVKFLVHQESNLNNLDVKNMGIVVKAESEMKDIEFYKKYDEVQLMTINTGKQGNEFMPEVLDRVEWLRKNGYKGIISLDGSVNLNSASIIRNFDVNKVSVGSYFSKSSDIESSFTKLNLALNLGNQK